MSNPLKSKILSESNWVGAKGGRCITDYTKRIVFQSEPSQDELTQVKTFLRDNDCPGWTGVTVYKRDNVTYDFLTTLDSSD